MNERKICRWLEPNCYRKVGYLHRVYWLRYRYGRSRKRKEYYRACIRIFAFNHDGSCSIRDIDDDYRYECCVQWWNKLHKNKPYKYKL